MIIRRYASTDFEDLEKLTFVRAKTENVEEMLAIIRRCMDEVNRKDYAPREFEKYLSHFTAEWLADIIKTRHYYEVRCEGKIIGCGGVSRDYSKEKQSYFTAIFINPDYHRKGIGKRFVRFLENDEWCLQSNLIEIPASKTACEFYRKCGYEYRTFPPVFSDADGSTIMYKEVLGLNHHLNHSKQKTNI